MMALVNLQGFPVLVIWKSLVFFIQETKVNRVSNFVYVRITVFWNIIGLSKIDINS